MKIFQKVEDDSLNIKFDKSPQDRFSDVSIKRSEDGTAKLNINGVEVDPAKGGGAINQYSESVTYSKNELVVLGGDIFRSLSDGNMGNPPATDKQHWVKLEHVIEYTDDLPDADDKSVSFAEIEGKLYYKSSNGSSYEYKKVSSESPPPVGEVTSSGVSVEEKETFCEGITTQKQLNMQTKEVISGGLKGWSSNISYLTGEIVFHNGAVYKAVTDVDSGNEPGKNPSKWNKIATSLSVVTSSEFNQYQSYDKNTIYLIRDYEKYSKTNQYSLTQSGIELGWSVSSAGLVNTNAHKVVTWEYAPAVLQGELARHIQIDPTGLISTAITEDGQLICRYNSPYEDSDFYSMKVYDEHCGWLEMFNKDAKPFQPNVIEVSQHRYIDGTHIDAPVLTADQIKSIAYRFCDNPVSFIKFEREYGQISCLPIVGGHYSSDKCVVSVLYRYTDANKPYLISFVLEEGDVVSTEVSDIYHRTITLGTSSGTISDEDLNTLKTSDGASIRYLDSETSTYYYLNKYSIEMLDGAPSDYYRYKCDKFNCSIHIPTGGYTVEPYSDKETIVYATVEKCFDTFDIPVIELNDFSTILNSVVLYNKPVIIRVGDGSYHAMHVTCDMQTRGSFTILWNAGYYNKDCYVRYDLNGKSITYTVTPVSPFEIVVTNTAGSITEEQCNIIKFFKENVVIKYMAPDDTEYILKFYKRWKDGYYYHGGDKMSVVDSVENLFMVNDFPWEPPTS